MSLRRTHTGGEISTTRIRKRYEMVDQTALDESQELQMGLPDCGHVICIGAVLVLDGLA